MNIFDGICTDPEYFAIKYNQLTDLKSPVSVKINPLHFTKKQRYPRGKSFNSKSSRFKQTNIFKNKVGPGTYRHDIETLEERAKSIKVKIKKFSHENIYMRNSLGRTTDRFGDKVKSYLRLKNFGRDYPLECETLGGVKDWKTVDNVGPYDSGCYDNGSFTFFQEAKNRRIEEKIKKRKEKIKPKSHRIMRKGDSGRRGYDVTKEGVGYLMSSLSVKEREKEKKKGNFFENKEEEKVIEVEEIIGDKDKQEELETVESPVKQNEEND